MTTVTGQLWFLTEGSTSNARLSYVNNDGSTDTVLVDNTVAPHTELGTFNPTDVQVDWAAGVYFIVANGGPDGSGAEVLMGHINSSAAPTVVYTAPASDSVNTLQIDPLTHHVYVGKLDAAGDETKSGVLDFTYAPGATSTPLTLTPVATNSGWLFTTSQVTGLPNDPGVGFPVLDPRSFTLDHATHSLFFVNELDGTADENQIFKVDLNNPTHVTAVTEQSQFPVTTDGTTPFSNGYITGLQVDPSTGLLYFTTHSQSPSGAGSYNVNTDHIYYIAETATGTTAATAVTLTGMPGSTASVFYPGEITLDLQNRMIYVGSEQTGSGGGADANSADDSIFVFQLSADGHSATYVRTITPAPAFNEAGDNINDMTFDNIPALSGLAATTTHAGEQGAAVTLLTGAPTITDIDGDHLSSVTVQITGGTFSSNENSTADDHLSVSAGALTGTNITASFNAATETLTLSGYDTLAHYQAVLAAVQYATTGDNPTNYGADTTRTITWTASDGAPGIPDGQQNQGTTTVTIDAVNDAPVNSVGATLAATEDTAIAVTGVSISDVDANPATATMTVTLSVSDGTLTATAFGSVGIAGSGTATVTLTGTQNDINGLIAGSHVTYLGSANYNGNDTLHVVTSDGGATGSGGTLSDTDDKAITVAAVNDPVTDAAPATATLNEDSSTAVAGMSISDVDAVLAPNGVYEVTLSSSHGALTLTTLAGLTFTTGDGTADGTMTFHGTLANINAALATASYAGNADYNGSDQISLLVTDTFGGVVATGSGAATSDTHTVNVTVNAVNDPVTATVPAAVTVNEDVAGAITGVSISDVDAVLAPNGVYEVTVSASHGTLTMTSLAGLTFTAGDGTADATMTFHGTLSNINAALATLGYLGASNFNGSDSIDVHVTDTFGGVVATGSGAATSDDQSIAVTVNSVNDAPTTSANSVTTLEDVGYVFTTGDFPFSDPNDSPANLLLAVKIVSLPTHGTLTDNGVAVSAGQLVSVSDIAAGDLVFTPATNANGSAYATFQFDVQDDGGTTHGGVDTSSAATMTVNVTPVNDAPTFTDNSAAATYNEDSPAVAVAPSVMVADDQANFAGGTLTADYTGAQLGDLLAIASSSTPGTGIEVQGTNVLYNGTVIGTEALNGTQITVTLNSAADPTAVQALTEAFTFIAQSDPAASNDRIVTFTLVDGGGTANGGHDTTSFSATVHVVPDNDPTIANDDTATTDEAHTVNIAVLANDTDVDSAVSGVAKVDGQAISAGGTVTIASGAHVTLNNDGTLTYDPNGKFNSLTSTAGGETGAVNTSAPDSFTYTNTDGNSANVAVTVNGVASPDDRLAGDSTDNTITGTPGSDFFMLQQGGDDVASGLAGNDVFYFGGALTGADHVDGGPGNDIVAIQGDYPSLTLGAHSLDNIETLSLLTHTDARFGGDSPTPYSYDITTVDGNVGAGQTLTVNASTLQSGENLLFDGSAETDGSFFIYAGAGTDHLIGGAQADIFFFAEGRYNAGDTVVGGAGNDIVVLRGDYSGANAVHFAANAFSGIETVTLMSASDTRFFGGGTRYSYDITTDDGNVAAGATMTFNGATLQVGEVLHFDGSAEMDGNFRIFGGADNDTIIGGHGNDLIYGGLGADTLTGGAGNDTFLYQSVAESTPGSQDNITDFSSGDIIDLNKIDADTTLAGKQSFTFMGANAFDGHAGELRAVETDTVNHIWTIQGDVNGDGVADFQLTVHVADAHTLTANDFHF